MGPLLARNLPIYQNKPALLTVWRCELNWSHSVLHSSIRAVPSSRVTTLIKGVKLGIGDVVCEIRRGGWESSSSELWGTMSLLGLYCTMQKLQSHKAKLYRQKISVWCQKSIVIYQFPAQNWYFLRVQLCFMWLQFLRGAVYPQQGHCPPQLWWGLQGPPSDHTSQERQPAAVPELLINQPHQSSKQSRAEDHTEQIEATSKEDHRWRTGRLQSRYEHHRAELQPTLSL